MKTTLNIDDSVFAELKRQAAQQGRTMSELVEAALRLLLDRAQAAPELPPLPRLSSGGALIDISDRDQIYDVMGDR